MKKITPNQVFAKNTSLHKLASFLLVFLLVMFPLLTQAQEVVLDGDVVVAEASLTPKESGIKESGSTAEFGASFDNQVDLAQSVDENKEDDSKKGGEDPKDPPIINSFAPQPQPFDPRDFPNGNRPKTDEVSGALVYTFPLKVPLGRNGLDPKLSLQYSSQATDISSPLGYGWSINIPYIERVNKTGVEKMYTDNYFTSSLSGELASVSSGVYAPKVENSDFLRYTLSSNVWTVTDKNGTKYKFGMSPNSRQDNVNNTANVYKWMLEEVRDTNNNYITYTYYKDAGQIYPDTITYTGNNVTSGIFSLVFSRSSRTDATTQSKGGFEVTTNYKVTDIQAKVNGVWVRKYSLGYTTGDNTQKTLLNSITESGQDENSNVTTLPAVVFTYQVANSPAPFTNESWTSPNVNVDTRAQNGDLVIDVNSDGLPDILHSYEGSSWIKGAYINNGDGTWTVSSGYVPPVIFASSADPYDRGVRAADVNGDGKADLVQSIDGFGMSIHGVYINTGSGWSLNASWVPPYEFSNPTFGDTGGRMGDINGDGLPDFYKNGSPAYINTGSGWISDSGWTLPVDLRYGVIPVDYNNDGLLDFLKGYRNNLGVDIKAAYKNNGDKTWSVDSTYAPPIIFAIQNNGSAFPSDVGVRVMDIDGDGLQDIVKASDSANSNQRETHLNTGHGWISSAYLLGASFIGFYGDDSGARYGDFDGDGMVDFYYSGPSIGTVLQKHTKLKSDLMSTITNQYGGVTTIAYKGSPLYMNGSTRLNQNLPYVLDTVYQISSDYGFGNPTEIETYTYEGGEYYFSTYLDRKPAGFSKVIKKDAANNKVVNFYHQGNITNTLQGEYDDHPSKIGKVYRTEIIDGSGNVYQKIINKWDKYNLGTGRDFVKLLRSTTLTYDGDSDHKDSATEYLYDDTYGNVSNKISWGEVTGSDDGSFTDTGTDKVIENMLYVTNTGNYVVGLPYQDTVVDQNSNKVRETRTYYDSLPLGSVGVGNPTKIEQWKNASNYIGSQKTYNTTYGIVTSEIDPRGKITSYVYDAYKLYPASVTNPLSQVVSYVYDYSLGKPKQVTDQNNFIYQTKYDGLDRVTAEKVPDIYYPHTPVDKITYVYTDIPGASSVKTSRYLDSTVSKDSYVYFDGLGRKIQEREEGESDYNVRDYAYNNLGLVQKESLPYNSFGSLKTPATSTPSLYTNYVYDPMLRPLSVTNSIGTTGFVYDDLKTSVTDPRGKIKHYYKDFYNNLVQVDEENDGSVYTTKYNWNFNGKLTKITDALANIRNFTYDGLGRRSSAEDLHAPLDTTFGVWTYLYDDAGNLTQATNPENQIVDYEYDDINRVLTENNIGTSGIEITYVYDACLNGVGKLCSVVQPKSKAFFEYTPTGLLDRDTREIGKPVFVTSFLFDRQGNVLKIVNPDQDTFYYTYNNAGLLEKIQYSQAGMKSMALTIVDNLDYSPLNRVTYQKNGNGTETVKTYDSTKLYRLSRIHSLFQGVNLQDLNYTYDNNGNITKIIDASDTESSKTVDYVYDDLNRLTSATATNIAGKQLPYTQSFVYDAIGNITSKSDVGSYLYQGELGSSYANPHAATSIDGTTNTYDKNGNMLTNGTLTNVWNYKQQLMQLGVNGDSIEYLYDHEGQRLRTKKDLEETYYPNKYYNADASSKSTKNVFVEDHLVATIDTDTSSNSISYNFTDHLGSVNVVTDGNGVITKTLDYYPFGSQRVVSGTGTSQRQFIGEIFDQSSGLNYLNARYYDGNRGQFISQDPEFWVTSQDWLLDPQNQNSYAYARNNPINLSDPSGKSWLTGAQGFSKALAVSALVTAAILSAPVTIPAAVLTGVAAVGLGAVGYGTYSNYQAYTSGQISKDQFDYNAGSLLGGTIPLGGLGRISSGVVGEAGAVTNQSGEILYRGGNSLNENGLRFDKSSGNIKSGFSLNTDPNSPNILNKGGAHTLDRLPESLKIEQQGTNPSHYHLMPTDPNMSKSQYIQAAKSIKLTPKK